MSLLTRLPNTDSQFPFFCSSNSLVFYLDNSTRFSQVLTLYNPYDLCVRYKVLCTAPRTYSIVEPEGEIHPRHSVDITVHLIDRSPIQNIVHKIRIQYYDRSKPQVLVGKRDITCTVLSYKPVECSFHDDINKSPNEIRIATRTKILQQQKNPSLFVVLIIFSIVCATILMLPVMSDNQNSINMHLPIYFYTTINCKIAASYVLGLLTVVFIQRYS